MTVNFGDITKIDIGTLTNEQVEALYRRLLADAGAEIGSMTDTEIDAELAAIALAHNPDLIQALETILFDDVTVRPPVNIETNRRHEQMMAELRAANGGLAWDRKPWRNAPPSDRYRMLAAAWKRETGEDLVERIGDLGSRAVMELEFDLADERNWMAWPKVRLKHIGHLALGQIPVAM